MKCVRIVGASALAVCLAGAMLYAADGAPAAPVKGQGLRERVAEKIADKATALRAAARLGFILEYLNEFPDVKEAAKEHRTKVQALQGQLKTLRELVRAKLQDAKTLEERQAAIDTARLDAESILTKVIDEAIRHQKAMAELAEKHKADVVKLAVDRTFERRIRRAGVPLGGIAGEAAAATAAPQTPAETK